MGENEVGARHPNLRQPLVTADLSTATARRTFVPASPNIGRTRVGRILTARPPAVKPKRPAPAVQPRLPNDLSTTSAAPTATLHATTRHAQPHH